jgi:hypothetical protein
MSAMSLFKLPCVFTVCADLSAILPCLLCTLTLYRPLGQCYALSRSAFLMDNLDSSLRVFSFFTSGWESA